MGQFAYYGLPLFLPKNISDLVSGFGRELIRVRLSAIVIALEVKYQTFQRIVPFCEGNIRSVSCYPKNFFYEQKKS